MFHLSQTLLTVEINLVRKLYYQAECQRNLDFPYSEFDAIIKDSLQFP